MANRKVLINYHTSGSTAPVASNVYQGELVVAHETGRETIFTKNNANEMVPFITCAQTISIISGMVVGDKIIYDVQKKENDAHITVDTAGTAQNPIFKVGSTDVMSLSAFNAYSANTQETIKDMADLLDAVIDSAVTQISGDSIIVAQLVNETTGFNSYNLTHKTGHESTGFNKLATDAYGHVTASTAVTTADIQGLGFKTSAQTAEDISDAIEGLGAVSATTGKYFTAIGVNNGELVMEEEDLPTLDIESAGTGNVVASIAVNGHKITYQTASVATSEGIAELSAATIALSAGTVSEFTSAFTAIENLSADTDAALDVLAQDLEDLSAATVNMSGAVINNETNINTVSGDVIELSAATVAIEEAALTGVSLNNTPVTVTDNVATVPVTTSGSGIASATESGSVADAKAVKEYVENVLSSSVDYKGATDSEPSNPVKGDLWIASSAFTVGGKNVEVGDFIIWDGTKWDVIEKNLDGAITGTLTPGTVVLAETTNSVESLDNGTNGQVLEMVNGAPAWANLPVLASASTGEGNVVTDIAVNDHTITFAKSFTAASSADVTALSAGTVQLSADTVNYIKEVSGNIETVINQLSAGTIELVAASAASVFSSAKTYTDDKIDEVYASGASLIAEEIAKLDSTSATTDSGHYMTAITITDGKISAIGEAAVPAAVPVSTVAGTTGDTASAVLTGITTGGTDGHQLTLNATNKIFSASTADNAINAVSAQTAENAVSAQTSVSALTTVSAVSATTAVEAESAGTADKVAHALSVSGYATSESTALDTTVNYDGSEAKSLTFGTNTAAGKSMSMTSAGVVDVEIIDCGSY